MPSLFALVSLRHLRREPVRVALSVVGIALGVAVFIAIRLANRSAYDTFSASIDAVAGSATLQIVSDDGTGVPETLFREVRRIRSVAASTPVIELVPVAEADERPLILLGVDIFTDGAFRTYTRSADSLGPGATLRDLLSPNSIYISRTLAERYHARIGSNLPLVLGGVRSLTVVRGILDLDGPARAMGGNVAVMDIAAAQIMSRRPGKIDRIDLLVPEDHVAQAEEAVRHILPANVSIQRPGARGAQTQTMLRAFDLNLTALAFVATFVAMFLIYNTILTAVVRRRKEVGTLRAVGASRATIFLLFLSEAGAMGLIGSGLGLGLGILLFHAVVGQVSRTITTFYVLVAVNRVTIDPAVLGEGLILGLVSTLAAAVPPSLEAMRTPVRETLHTATIEDLFARRLHWVVFGAIISLAAAGVLAWLPAYHGAPVFGFASAGFIILGSSILIPGVVVLLIRIVRPGVRRIFGIEPVLALDTLRASLRRSSVAIAALMVSVAMLISINTMVGSFRQTVDTWIQQSVRFDLFLSLRSNTLSSSIQYPLPTDILDTLRSMPEVRDIDTFRGYRIRFGEGYTTLANVELAVAGRIGRLQFLSGHSAEIIPRTIAGNGVIVSESFFVRNGLGAGDTLALTAPDGTHRFPIEGVIYDYTSDAGLILMNRSLFVSVWKDSSVGNVAFSLVHPERLEAVRAELERRFAHHPGVVIQNNRMLRAAVLTIFDETFAVTSALEIIAILVAAIGVTATLQTIVVERGRELAVLKAVGADARQVRRLVLFTAAFMATIAQVVGTIAGILLALILIFVVNRQSFGWTVQVHLDPILIVTSFGGILLVAVGAALWPAWSASRGSVRESLHFE